MSLKLEHRIYKCQSHSCRLQLCTTKVTLKIISGTLGHITITFSAISVTDKIPLPINSIKAAEESTNLLPWWPLQWASVWDDGAVTATDTKCSLPNDHSHEEWNVASPACMRDVQLTAPTCHLVHATLLIYIMYTTLCTFSVRHNGNKSSKIISILSTCNHPLKIFIVAGSMWQKELGAARHFWTTYGSRLK